MKKSRIRVIVASFLATICAIGGVALGNYDGVAEQETKTSADFFSATKNAEIITDYQAPEHIGDYKGIFVKSTDSGATTVTLNHAIDLRAFTSEDILLTMLPVTTEPISKTTDLQLTSITVRLTDASDENVFVEMKVQRNVEADYPYAGYASARGNGQVLTGWNYQKETIQYHSGNNYGRLVTANFYGRARNGVAIENDIRPVSLMYDYESSCVHASASESWKGTLVADLTDSEHMKGQWSGFKSNSAYLSITAESETYNNKNAGFMILNFAGLDFSQTEWTDTEKPVLKIDTLGYDENNLPKGEAFRQYPVFEAKCFDMFDNAYGLHDGEKTLTVSVKKEGTDETLTIESGCFVPTQTGVYRISYVGEDVAGNRAEIVLSVTVDNAIEIEHSWLTPLQTDCTVGVKTTLPEQAIDGAYGEYETETQVYDVATGEKYELAYGGFVPQKEGTYCIFVSVEDFLGREGTFAYYVTAKAMKTPILQSAPSMPYVVILGRETSLPDFEAYDYYSFSGTKTNAEKFYEIRNEEGKLLKTVKAEEKFTPDASFGETIFVTYKAKSFLYEEAVSGTTTISVVDSTKPIDFTKYFMQKHITGTTGNYSGESCVTFFFDTEEAEVAIGQATLYDGLDISFRVPEEANAYDGICVTLTDGTIADRKVALTIRKSSASDSSDFYVNGVKSGTIFGTFDDSLLEDFRLAINSRGEIVDARNNTVCEIENYLSGETFEGFTDNLCYVSFTFENVSGESALQIVKIGGQYLDSDATEEYVGPELSLTSSFVFEQNVGTIRLPGAIAVDVLDGATTVEAEVYVNETNELIFSGTVGKKDWTLSILRSGKYLVRYYSEDGKENATYSDYLLSVYNRTPFTVTLSGSVPETVDFNKTVTLPSFTVDERISSFDAIVYVICPKGGRIDVTESLSFKATQRGEYKVYYYVVYETENSYLYNLTEYSVSVK